MPPSLAAYGRGVVAALPLQLATLPFGLIFGALAAQAGLDLAQVMGMTAVVVAGAAQLAALQLMAQDAPAWLAIATGTVVNLRMAMYSASIAQHWRGMSLRARMLAAFLLHDHAYAMSIKRYADHPEEPMADKLGFFIGVGLLSVAVWSAGCLVGALLGARLPQAWALEFAVPVAFLAIIAPLLRSAPHMAAAGAASGVALALGFLPLNLGLMLGALAGVAAGAATEAALARRGAR